MAWAVCDRGYAAIAASNAPMSPSEVMTSTPQVKFPRRPASSRSHDVAPWHRRCPAARRRGPVKTKPKSNGLTTPSRCTVRDTYCSGVRMHGRIHRSRPTQEHRAPSRRPRSPARRRAAPGRCRAVALADRRNLRSRTRLALGIFQRAAAQPTIVGSAGTASRGAGDRRAWIPRSQRSPRYDTSSGQLVIPQSIPSGSEIRWEFSS